MSARSGPGAWRIARGSARLSTERSVHSLTLGRAKYVAVRVVRQAMGEYVYEAGLSQATISRARHGREMRTSTLAAMSRALVRLKPLRGIAEMGLITSTPAV